jgi:hypothetical protein
VMRLSKRAKTLRETIIFFGRLSASQNVLGSNESAYD